MIKQKILKLHKPSSSSSADHKFGDERIDWNFSNIQAFQVPTGWDKLSVSLISAKKGKTVSRSGKASVRNGHCRWTETLSDSAWILHDDASKDLDQCLFKLVVSMGSTRSSILGEAMVNLAGPIGSKPVPLSLPLNKCSHGTIVQVEVQCVASRPKLRTETWKATNSFTEYVHTDNGDIDNGSDGSNCTFTKSSGSSSSSLTYPRENESRATTFSSLGSLPSSDSNDCLGRESFSPQSNLSRVVNYAIGRHDSTGSQNTSDGSYLVYDFPTSYCSPLQKADSSKNFLEADAVTVQELREESRMWEKNARKLMVDLESLRKEFLDQGKQLENLVMELTESKTECDGSKQEIEHLKEEALEKQKDIENMKLKDNIQKELEDEMRFQRESNGYLSLQLKKTQESNVELLSALLEMEEMVEKQKMEIENFSKLSKYDDTGIKNSYGHQDDEEVNPNQEEIVSLEENLSKSNNGQEMKIANIEKRGNLYLIRQIESLNGKVQELERDCTELTNENMELALKLKELKADHLPKKGEIEAQSSQQRDLKTQISDLQKLESEMENSIESTLANKILDLEEENVKLSERVSGLEAQLRYMTKESESNRLEAQNAESQILNFRDEIKKLVSGKEEQKIDMRNKLQESQEENKYLKKANTRLQARAESLSEECYSLKKSYGELRDQRLELHKQCNLLEAESRESQKLSGFSKKIEALESKFCSMVTEFSAKEDCLASEIDAIHILDNEHRKKLENDSMVKGLLQDIRYNEVKLNGTIDELESKLKSTNYEKLQLAEETSSLKIQLQKIPLLQGEALTLKNSIREMQFENEKMSFELEDYKCSEVALEEKILRLEEDITAKEELRAQEAEQENDLGQIKRINSQLQWKIKCLEEEKEECLEKVGALEEELHRMKEINSATNHLSMSNNTKSNHEELKLSEEEENNTVESSMDQSTSYVTDKLEQFPKGQDNTGIVHHIEVNNVYSTNMEIDPTSRIRFLENELAEALEANDLYKAQLKSILSECPVNLSDVTKLKPEDEATSKDENEQKVPKLEAELKEIRERYLQISLKCAEVEAQRELLVMKLKSVTGQTN